MNYEETLNYLYAQLPMFTRIGAVAFKKDLTNTISLCEALGNPQNKFKSVHIAGTNGKGSVSHSLSAIFQKSGFKTGLYTSPHLKDFRERIRINGALCDKQFVIDFVQKVKPLIEEIKPSFFELTVAMAFAYFAVQNVDIAVIETGLGGRLDSTNVLLPELSIITNIGWDHMDMLGDTLPKIAAEKAGIIKEGIPAIIGECLPETKPVFEKVAAAKNAPLFFAESEFEIVNTRWDTAYLHLTVKDVQTGVQDAYSLDLQGIYQQQNLRTILAAVRELRLLGWQLPEEKIHIALQNVKTLTGLHGRWEKIHSCPTVILDVGHNKSCMEQIRRQLDVTDYQQLHIVCGFVKDKDIHAALSLLPKDASYYFTNAHLPRAMPAIELQQHAAAWGIDGNEYDDVNEALHVAMTNAAPDDLVLVCGSVFLVAEVDLPQYSV